jgi:hypothetical protein
MKIPCGSLTTAIALMAFSVQAQNATLRERAASAEDELNVGLGYDFPSPPMLQLVTESDLIIYGHVVSATSYLSQDSMLIYSDYQIDSRRIITGLLPPAERPGQHSTVVVTHVGGELQLEGKRVRVILLPKLPIGSDVILLLKRGDKGKYAIVEEGYGAFAAESGAIRALARRGGAQREFDGRSASEFERAIQSWRSGLERRR